MTVLPDPALPPWPQYASAVVELILDDEHLVLTPCPSFSGALSPLVGRDGPIWVLTAGDPYPLELSATENAARNAALRVDLEEAGAQAHPALGRAIDGSTAEISLAVRACTREMVLGLAGRYGQLAVYEISDAIRCIDVATGHVVTSVPFRLEVAPAGSDRLIGPTGWRG